MEAAYVQASGSGGASMTSSGVAHFKHGECSRGMFRIRSASPAPSARVEGETMEFTVQTVAGIPAGTLALSTSTNLARLICAPDWCDAHICPELHSQRNQTNALRQSARNVGSLNQRISTYGVSGCPSRSGVSGSPDVVIRIRQKSRLMANRRHGKTVASLIRSFGGSMSVAFNAAARRPERESDFHPFGDFG